MNSSTPSKSSIQLTPIGVFRSTQVEPYQASRQPDEFSVPGQIVLNEKNNFEQALQNLSDCSHIWILFYFHHNDHWKPLVQTPRSQKKIGVFATRAPYRPNPLGMTAVKLVSVDGLIVHVGPNDLLDGTPILDIKPYHGESDQITDSEIRWLDSVQSSKYAVKMSPYAEAQFDFVERLGFIELKPFVFRQLEYDPVNADKKRVKKVNDLFELSYRTWRIDFVVTEDIISILSLRSGYSPQDLALPDDKYQDKALHQKFNANFN